ncbi:T6SS effector phospholipase Tle3 domain-containing protein [Pseudomonas aeruginosa]
MPKGGDVHLVPPPPKPCVTIVVHGVNDLAGCYERIERGVCQGSTNAWTCRRPCPAGRPIPATRRRRGYSLPADDEGQGREPRRRLLPAASPPVAPAGAAVRSVVVPFYWGFREEEQYINKTAAHGEWLDRNGNRLDKSGTKEGGQFVNATTNLPDMWARVSTASCSVSSRWTGSAAPMTHPLFSAAGRKYMVLAGHAPGHVDQDHPQRYPDDTINVVGHARAPC